MNTKRVKLFLVLIWDDIGIPLREVPLLFITTTIIGVVVIIPIISLAYILSLLMKTLVSEAILPAFGIIMLLFGIVLAINYLRKKWKASKLDRVITSIGWDTRHKRSFRDNIT